MEKPFEAFLFQIIEMEKLEEIHQIKSERLVVDDPNASLVDAMTDYKRREGLVFACLGGDCVVPL